MTSGNIIQRADVVDRDLVEDAADVVIVGSGAAGATAARVLTEAGVDVVVVEEGPHIPTDVLRSDMYTAFKRSWRDMGFQVAQGRAFTPILQGCCLGGTTAVNGAIIHRMPEAIHDRWCRERGVDDVIRYDELSRIWDRLDDELAVGPAPDAVYGRNNALMEAGVSAMGMTGNRIRRNVRDCEGSAHCNQGCPTARRQSMNVSYVPKAIRGGARVYADCKARVIRMDGGRATGIEARFVGPDGARGPELRASARHAVVLAASAIQTPTLLADNGLGNRSGQLGRRLQAHPGTGVAGVFAEPVTMWSGATQGYESTHFWDERMKFETVAMPLEFGAVRLPGTGTALVERLADYGHVAMWGVQVRAEAQGRVRRGLFGQRVIEYDSTDADVERLKTGVKRLVEMMFAAGARAVYPGVFGLPEVIESADEAEAIFDLPNDPRYFHCIAAHLFGTAVMSADPDGGVVGLDGSVHDTVGLYVADSSVFPTNLGVNPQHSIAAIAWLYAERIANSIS